MKKRFPGPFHLSQAFTHLLSALESGRGGEEAGVDHVDAETADHLERNGEKPDAVAGCRHSAGLIFKTVPDPAHLHEQDVQKEPISIRTLKDDLEKLRYDEVVRAFTKRG